jgi:pimeloyl-ACP methyl ester carboxylesterase
LVYGFSRGAQLAHRYALLYPEKTLAVTTIAAGSYTMPFANLSDMNLKVTQVESKNSNLLPFPFGMGDAAKISTRPFNRTAFKKVNFWLEVGDQDTKNSDVPRDFDPYQGANRLERAKAFYGALKQVGNNVSLHIYPNVGHGVSAEMRQQACNFFRSIGQMKG